MEGKLGNNYKIEKKKYKSLKTILIKYFSYEIMCVHLSQDFNAICKVSDNCNTCDQVSDNVNTCVQVSDNVIKFLIMLILVIKFLIM